MNRTRVRRGFPDAGTCDLFDDTSNYELRYVPDYDRIRQLVGALRLLGLRVVLTSGSFDILHEGHSMYLEAARQLGDFLIVGVDSDEKIRIRKGPGRPVVPEQERLRMVCHQRGVGLVTLKRPEHPQWALIKAVEPDVLVATEDTYKPDQIDQLEASYCQEVVVLKPMATVTTSARLRLLHLRLVERLSERLAESTVELGLADVAGSQPLAQRYSCVIENLVEESVSPCPSRS